MERNYRTYVHGSAAPARVEETPVRVPRRTEPLTKEEIRRRQASRYAEENRRKAGRFGALYTAVIVFAVFVTMFTCVNYINVLNRQSANNKKIMNLSNELEALKESNDQKQLAIDTSINYDYIYKVATEELGMVHAGKDQVVEYKSGESEYVIQYLDLSSID